MRIRGLLVFSFAVHAFAPIALALPSQHDDGWRLRLTPYLWAPSIDGSVKVEDDGGDAEEEGGSALDYLSGAAMLTVEATRGDWSLLGDFVWARFDLQGTLDGPAMTPFDATNEELILGIGAARTVARGASGILDGVFGLRYLHADVSLDPQGGSGLEHSASADLVDPFVGLRGRFGGDDGFFGQAYGDIGGFGVSADLTWQVTASVGWGWNWGDVQLGWREIAYDFDEGGLVYDLAASGPFLALSFRL